MRASLAIALVLPVALTGCPALLSDWKVTGSGAVDASVDATGPDVAAGRSGSGGRGGGGSSGSSGGSSSGGGAGDSGPACVTDLSGVGTGDFRIDLDVSGLLGAKPYALVNQRASCPPYNGWAMYTSSTGAVELETDDANNADRVFQIGGTGVNDGKAHHVAAWRSAGRLFVQVDATPASPAVVDTNTLGSLPSLVIGSDACTSDAAPLVGSLTGLCVTEGGTSGTDAGTCAAGAKDLQADPSNCGRCGHDCQGGACSAGVCQPVTLATGQTLPWGIAVDATSVYWTKSTNPGAVMKVPIGGGNPMTLASGQNGPAGIAVDPTSVYWANYGIGTLMKVPVIGGAATTLASAQSAIYAIAVDATSVYWTSYATAGPSLPAAGTVMKAPLGGGSSITLASGQNGPNGIAIDATSVYWTNGPGGTVMKVPIGGGSPITLVSGQSPNGIAVDTTNVYWTNNGDGTVMRAPLSGGTPTTLVSGQSRPVGIAVDATSVYWATLAGGTVMKVAKP